MRGLMYIAMISLPTTGSEYTTTGSCSTSERYRASVSAACDSAARCARDVDHDALPEQRGAGRIADEDGLVVEPDLAAVAMQHPVVGGERQVGDAVGLGGVLGMALPLPRVRVGEPLFGGEPEEVVDLGAHVQQASGPIVAPLHGLDVHDARQPLHHAAEPRLGLEALFLQEGDRVGIGGAATRRSQGSWRGSSRSQAV